MIAGLFFFLFPCRFSSKWPAESHCARSNRHTYFGTKIVDPYRWMEDSKSAETAAWMKAQADYTRAYLDRLPIRAQLLKRFEELSETGVRVSGVQRAANLYFYYRLAPGGKRSPASAAHGRAVVCSYQRPQRRPQT